MFPSWPLMWGSRCPTEAALRPTIPPRDSIFILRIAVRRLMSVTKRNVTYGSAPKHDET